MKNKSKFKISKSKNLVTLNKINQKIDLNTQYKLDKSGAFPFTEENIQKMVIIELSGMGRVKLVLVDKNREVLSREVFLMRF